MQLLVLTFLFGGPYVVPVLIAFWAMPRLRGSRFGEAMAWGERALVFLPIVVYLVLEYLVQMRQGFATWQAQGVLAVPGVLAVALATFNRRWARAGVAGTVLAAVALWWFYPGQTGWRLF